MEVTVPIPGRYHRTGSTGSDYKVIVQSTSQPNVKDTSNNNFIITTGTTASSITVASPNGGETWQRGKTYPITWSYAGSPGSSVSIVLLKGGAQVLTIAPNTPIGSGGSGSYSWKIPSDKPIGKDYQVRIQSTSKPTIKDTSNNYFSIVPQDRRVNHGNLSQWWRDMATGHFAHGHLGLFRKSRFGSEDYTVEGRY